MTESGGRVTFSEASKRAGVHINTIRNWRRAGRLKTAQLVVENGSEVWLVELDEILAIAGGGGSQRSNSTDNNFVNDNINNAGTQALANLLTERAELQRALTEAQEARRKDANQIGELAGQLRAVEREIEGFKGRERNLTRLVIGLVAALVILAVVVAIVAVVLK